MTLGNGMMAMTCRSDDVKKKISKNKKIPDNDVSDLLKKIADRMESI